MTQRASSHPYHLHPLLCSLSFIRQFLHRFHLSLGLPTNLFSIVEKPRPDPLHLRPLHPTGLFHPHLLRNPIFTAGKRINISVPFPRNILAFMFIGRNVDCRVANIPLRLRQPLSPLETATFSRPTLPEAATASGPTPPEVCTISGSPPPETATVSGSPAPETATIFGSPPPETSTLFGPPSPPLENLDEVPTGGAEEALAAEPLPFGRNFVLPCSMALNGPLNFVFC